MVYYYHILNLIYIYFIIQDNQIRPSDTKMKDSPTEYRPLSYYQFPATNREIFRQYSYKSHVLILMHH